MSSGWQLTWLFKLFALSSDLAILKIYPKKQNKTKKPNKEDTLKDLLEEGSSEHPF